MALPSQGSQARTCLGPKVEKLWVQGLASFPLPFPGSSQASPGPHSGPSQGTTPRAQRGLHSGPAPGSSGKEATSAPASFPWLLRLSRPSWILLSLQNTTPRSQRGLCPASDHPPILTNTHLSFSVQGGLSSCGQSSQVFCPVSQPLEKSPVSCWAREGVLPPCPLLRRPHRAPSHTRTPHSQTGLWRKLIINNILPALPLEVPSPQAPLTALSPGLPSLQGPLGSPRPPRPGLGCSPAFSIHLLSSRVLGPGLWHCQAAPPFSPARTPPHCTPRICPTPSRPCLAELARWGGSD